MGDPSKPDMGGARKSPNSGEGRRKCGNVPASAFHRWDGKLPCRPLTANLDVTGPGKDSALPTELLHFTDGETGMGAISATH